MMTQEEKERFDDKLAYFNKIDKANKEGYAGCLPNGNLVDRREVPEAYPVAANKMFNVAEPRCINCNNITPSWQLVKSLCRNCRPPEEFIKNPDGAGLENF